MKFGLALGGGGIKGLAHIGLLKCLDRHQLKPSVISGSSMGAIIGALYARGLSGEEIESRIRTMVIHPGEKWKSIFRRRAHLLNWIRVLRPEKGKSGLVTPEGLFQHLFDELLDVSFEDLDIPFVACACDFHSAEEVALKEGELLPALRASIAIPGAFAPIELGGRLLLDGGLVNNVPLSMLEGCDKRIACNVISAPSVKAPTTSEVINGGLTIMVVHMTRKALQEHPADFILNIDTDAINAMDLLKIDEALTLGDAAARENEALLLATLTSSADE